MHIDVYNAKLAAQKNIETSEKKKKKLNLEEQRLVGKMVQMARVLDSVFQYIGL